MNKLIKVYDLKDYRRVLILASELKDKPTLSKLLSLKVNDSGVYREE